MIFCVEDDISIRDIEVYTLKSTGFNAIGIESSTDLFKELEDIVPELIILDIMLPFEDGISILKKLKSNIDTKDIPIIMATAKSEEFDKILSLDLGADDYLVKPFGMMEMVARVKAVLRRSGKNSSSNILKNGLLIMDIQKHTVFIEKEKLILNLKEFELLRLFLSNPDIVFSRNRLLSDIWGIDYSGETRTLDVHISSLRNKLGKYQNLISTIRGIGYKMEVMEID